MDSDPPPLQLCNFHVTDTGPTRYTWPFGSPINKSSNLIDIHNHIFLSHELVFENENISIYIFIVNLTVVEIQLETFNITSNCNAG